MGNVVVVVVAVVVVVVVVKKMLLLLLLLKKRRITIKHGRTVYREGARSAAAWVASCAY